MSNRIQRHYYGRSDGDGYKAGPVYVVVHGKPLPLDPCFEFVNHSPCGFGWGYGGSGPAQLSFAILFDHFTAAGEPEPVRSAMANYQHFKADVVARLPDESWTLQADTVEEWVKRRKENPDA